jgi:hypothetical protein
MDRSKLVAILTGAIALILGVGYLILVQLLDMRGEMLPAPMSQLSPIVDRFFNGFDLKWLRFLLH